MKGCFVYLVNHNERAISDGERSLALLRANYLLKFPVPVLLFHEAGLTDAMKARLSAEADATFVLVDFSSYPQGTGYNHMCRFFAGEVFKHPALADFDYYCRLDTDSFILAPVAYDLFERAVQIGAWYGFLNDEIVDNPSFSQGLWEAARRFIDRVGIAPLAGLYTDIPEGRLYYTNFEVCYLPWFRGALWQAFYGYLDSVGGIYAHRWGDHTMRYIGVRSFMPASRIWRVEGVSYSHQGIGSNRAA